MCGIVGVAGSFSRDECLDILRKMNAAIVHRGPDDEGFWAEDGFGMGMRRLSIIDLAGGHQPMLDEQGRMNVVFNGEIYNYRALQDEFRAEGHQFRTTSDTEVVLKTLVERGLAGIHKWNGMFAVGAWDPREKKLVLIRDRMGVKPLYYFYDGKTFLFASEIKAILASGLVERSINRQALWDYLTFRFVPGPETIWTGIRKLPPAHFLEFRPGQAPVETRYWQSDVNHQNGSGNHYSEEQLDKEFAELFLDSVRLRLEASDVPVGVMLSGGLDSSAVAAAAIELGHRNFHTFSVGFEQGGYYSELPYAKQVADHVGANYHEVVIGQKEFLEMLPELVYYSDEPLCDLASVPLLAVSRLAQQNVKVVLSGEGSDEILAGYDLELSAQRWQTVRNLQRVPRPLLSLAAHGARVVSASAGEKLSRVARLPLSQWNSRERPHMTRYLDEQEKSSLWPNGDKQSSERHLVDLYAAATASDPLQQLLSVYQKSWLVEDLLMKADKMSMAASVELRTPFLDYRLVEWANRQPNHAKIKRLGFRTYETKSVLRRFCARRLPREVLTRTKRGFPVPVNGWLQNGLANWARDVLTGTDSRIVAAFTLQRINELIAGAEKGSVQSAGNVWLLLVLEFWLQAWDARLN
ncbi:MAG TPA: asparagine synthase (glutamine-hydrolyzing) [Pyrinomonadaceae bacterium]|nr:asparagine synthase (glutamine-hydrolyzing) [Pyrinomonadaceae bacterium]